jgi:RNA polymerase sigma-70 factor (ECF subfamily)
VTRNKLYSFLDSQRRQVRATGDGVAQGKLEEQPDPDSDLAKTWNEEYERRLAGKAMERVQKEFGPTVWQSFYQTAVEGKEPKLVAQTLKTSPGAVYVARSRVLSRLKQEVERLQSD